MGDTTLTPRSRLPLHVFLCHSSADKPVVRDLYQRLMADGIEVWFDEESLLPGQDWQVEIPKAVRKADIVIVCLSRGSVGKAGYVQKEIKIALDAADEQPAGTIYVIPLKLEECAVPERLSRWHWVGYYDPDGYDRLKRALQERVKSLKAVNPVLETVNPTRDRILDAAIARRVPVGKPTDLVVLVRRADSAGLRAILEIDTTYQIPGEEVISKSFPVEFPVRPDGTLGPARLTVRIDAPQFDPKSQSKTISVPLEGDSEICTFLLTPQHIGELRLNLEIYAGDLFVTSRLLMTNGESSERDFIVRSKMIISIPFIVSGYWPLAISNTAISGGVNADAERIDIGGDVVGRDKISTSGDTVAGDKVQINAQPGSTVIINEQPVPESADPARQSQAGTESAVNTKDRIVALNQLEPPPADFTGREKELTDLLEAHQHGSRIFGLYGAGGVGKTALAAQFARQLEEQYSDAQIFLDLGGASDHPLPATEVMAHVIRAFDLYTTLPEDQNRLKGLYQSRLHGKRILILLDNAKDAAQVELLRSPETCCLIITSREHFMLPGLQAKNVNALSTHEARALLLKIASPVGDRADEIARLCGYFPLALRQVGASIAGGELMPEECVRLLTDANRRWRLLGPVKASFEMRYALLDKASRARWRRLAMFPAEFTGLEAGALWNLRSDAADDQLLALRKRSLIERSEQTECYFLLDLVRDYLREKLTDAEREKTQNNISQALKAKTTFHYKLALLFSKQLCNPDWRLTGIRPAVLEILWDLVDGSDQPEERLAAALQLLNLHWWSDGANIVDIEQVLAFLELVAPVADTPVQRHWLIDCISPWLNLELDARQRAQLFIHKAALQAQLYEFLDEAGRVSPGGEQLSTAAKEDYDKAERLIRPFTDSPGALPEDHWQLARIYLGQGNYTMFEADICPVAERDGLLMQAVEVYSAALKAAQDYGEDLSLIVTILQQLCYAYTPLLKWANAEEHYLKALSLLETELITTLNPRAYATLYFLVQNSAAQMYAARAEVLKEDEPNDAQVGYDNARRLTLGAIAQLEQHVGDSENLAIAYFNVGDCFQALDNPGEAGKYWRLAREVARRRGVWYVEQMADERLKSPVHKC
jgi:hypothetical protein